MSGPKAPPISLDDPERLELERLVAGHRTAQQIAKRARIILLAGQGKGDTEIVRMLNTSRKMVRWWRRRWLDLQPIRLADLSVAERLEDLPRPGAPRQLTAEQICQIEEMACEQPQAVGRPISQWTGREIADEIVKRGIVARISPRHASRLVKRGISSRIASASG